jgi:hypothetical protein
MCVVFTSPAVTYKRRYVNSDITGVATKINLLMYVEHEQQTYAAAEVTQCV